MGGQDGLDPLKPKDKLAVQKAPLDLCHAVLNVTLRLMAALRDLALHLQLLPCVVGVPLLPMRILLLDSGVAGFKAPVILMAARNSDR